MTSLTFIAIQEFRTKKCFNSCCWLKTQYSMLREQFTPMMESGIGVRYWGELHEVFIEFGTAGYSGVDGADCGRWDCDQSADCAGRELADREAQDTGAAGVRRAGVAAACRAASCGWVCAAAAAWKQGAGGRAAESLTGRGAGVHMVHRGACCCRGVVSADVSGSDGCDGRSGRAPGDGGAQPGCGRDARVLHDYGCR